MKVLVIVCVLLFSSVVSIEKCCVECTKEEEIKYYYINTIFDRCGEFCMIPDKFWLIYQSGIEEAEVDNPCEEKGYTEYERTVTNAEAGMTLTMDKYRKPY